MKILSNTVGAFLLWSLSQELLLGWLREYQNFWEEMLIEGLALIAPVTFLFLRIVSIKRLPRLQRFWLALGIGFFTAWLVAFLLNYLNKFQLLKW